MMNQYLKQVYLEKENTSLLWLQIKALKQQIAFMEKKLIPKIKRKTKKKSLYGIFKGIKFTEKEIEEAKKWAGRLWQ